MKHLLKYIFVFFVIVIAVFTITYFISEHEDKSSLNGNNFYLNVVKQNDNHWIYEISKNNQLFIRQEYIPVVSGKQKFRSKKDAEAIGNVVLNKLSKNVNPILTIDDIKSSNVSFE